MKSGDLQAEEILMWGYGSLIDSYRDHIKRTRRRGSEAGAWAWSYGGDVVMARTGR